MERTNGKMSATFVEVEAPTTRVKFSPYNYILDNFATTPQTQNTVTKKDNPRMMWPMVDTVDEVVESFNKLTTKRKLTIHESKTNTTSRAAKTTKQR